nr:unnamed protein product [Digitaria exilis]
MARRCCAGYGWELRKALLRGKKRSKTRPFGLRRARRRSGRRQAACVRACLARQARQPFYCGGERSNGRKGGEKETGWEKKGQTKGERGRDGSLVSGLLKKEKARRGKFLASRGATSSPTRTDDAAAGGKVHRILALAPVGPSLPAFCTCGDGAPAGPRESRVGAAVVVVVVAGTEWRRER